MHDILAVGLSHSLQAVLKDFPGDMRRNLVLDQAEQIFFQELEYKDALVWNNVYWKPYERAVAKIRSDLVVKVFENEFGYVFQDELIGSCTARTWYHILNSIHICAEELTLPPTLDQSALALE